MTKEDVREAVERWNEEAKTIRKVIGMLESLAADREEHANLLKEYLEKTK